MLRVGTLRLLPIVLGVAAAACSGSAPPPPQPTPVVDVAAARQEAIKHLGAGNSLFDAGNIRGAFQEYQAAATLDPNNADAARNVRKTRDMLRSEAAAYIEAGTKLVAEANLKAKAEFQRALDVDPTNEEAQRSLEHTIEVLKAEAVRHLGAGNSLLAAGLLTGAKREFRQALLFDPANDDAKRNLQTVTEALRAEAVKHLGAGNTLLAAGSVRGANAEFAQAADLDPENKEAADNLRKSKAQLDAAARHLASGDSFLKARNLKGARLEYEAAVQANPESDEAKQGLQKTMDLIKAEVVRRLGAGNTLADAGNYEGARAELRQAAALDPANKDVAQSLSRVDDLARAEAVKHLGAAYSLVAASNYDGAAAELRRASALDPNNQEVQDAQRKLADLVKAEAVKHLGAGNTLAAAGNLDGALAEYQRALALDPANAQAKQNIQKVNDQKAKAAAA